MKKDEEKRGESSWAEGAISVLAVLEHHSRPVRRILLLPEAKRDEKNLTRVLQAAKKEKIPVSLSDAPFFEKVCTGHTHGGVIAEVGERRYSSLDEIFAPDDGFVFLICGIEDPFNFGSAVRSFCAAGATGMVLTPRNWLSAAGVTIRSSAGCTELLPAAAAEDNALLLETAKRRGYRIVCSSEKGAVPLFSADLKRPLFLIVGGEKRGITRDLLDGCEIKVRIPYGRRLPVSLTAADAAAVCAFEVLRQNMPAKGN